MSDKDGGPAFPGGVNSVYTNIDEGCPTQEGMTLRDYFAAKALAAIITKRPHHPANTISEDKADAITESVATGAYDYADAMLAAREAK